MPTFSDRSKFKTSTDNVEAKSSSRPGSPKRLQSYRNRAMMFSPDYAQKYQLTLMMREQQQDRASTMERESRGKEPAHERVHPHNSSLLVEAIVGENGQPHGKDVELNKDNERLLGGMWNTINNFTAKKAQQYWDKQTAKYQFTHCNCIGHSDRRQEHKKFENRNQGQTSKQQETRKQQETSKQQVHKEGMFKLGPGD